MVKRVFNPIKQASNLYNDLVYSAFNYYTHSLLTESEDEEEDIVGPDPYVPNATTSGHME